MRPTLNAEETLCENDSKGVYETTNPGHLIDYSENKSSFGWPSINFSH